jgi:exoribonuclease-2
MLGSVLDFIEKGRVLSAVVVGQKGTHFQVLTENAREMTLNPRRILNATPDGLDLKSPRHELVRRVKEMSQRRDEEKGRVNVRELWELLLGEGESFDPAYLSELAFGDRAPDHVSSTFRALFEEKTYFRLNQDRFAINSEEQVERITEAREREQRRERLLGEGAAWLKAVATGEPAQAPADGAQIVELLKGETVWGRDSAGHQDAAELLGRAGLSRPEAAFELLVALGVWSPDENLDLIRLEVPLEFPEAVEAEAARLVAEGCALYPGRLELRGGWLATIDGPSTRDYDDALSVERTERGLRVGVHVADVGACVARGGELEREALERGATVYLPEARLAMLPPALSEGLCSLKAGEDKPAISVFAELSPEGEVLSFELARSLIRVEQQLTYEQVDAAPDERLGWLLEAARNLRRRRLEAGAILLPIPEVQIRVGEGEIGVRQLDTDSPSRVLVSEMMILANSLMARALAEAAVPAIYRWQDEPRERLSREGQDELFIMLRQCRLLSRAEWSTSPRPHSNLGVPVYTSVTSPIRRAVDLLVQRQVAALLGEGTPQSEEELLAALSRIEEAQRRNAALEQRRVRYWLLRYLEGHVGERFEALVLGQWPRRFQVILVELLLEGELPLGSGLSVGQRVAVRIERADARRDVLQLAL